jgi:Uma2 family endonuclease
MTVIETPLPQQDIAVEGAQRFVFYDVDWQFYEQISRLMERTRAFVTYYKGKLELVTISLLHERIAALLTIIVQVLAEETNTPMIAAGMTTLKRQDLNEATEPDRSFYTTHELQMRGKQQLDLSIDPPPDIAIEVEVTRRLGERKSIYQDLGVPEIWIYGTEGISILLHSDAGYSRAEKSPTFPQISPQEILGFITAGLSQDQTAFTKAFRRRVKETL